MWRERAPWHRQQAVLHQLLGHVLALLPCQEAPDRLSFKFTLSLYHVCVWLVEVCTQFVLCSYNTKFILGLRYAFIYITLCLLLASQKILTNWIHPLHACPRRSRVTGHCQGRFWSWEALNALPRARNVNLAWTMCKPKYMVYIEKGSMWTYVNVPSVYATGCARSDFITCLPVPWRGWGPLVRSKPAVFWYSILSESAFWPVLPRQ